jgi:ribosome-binding ATPase YchF (GTP1/OBG family)
MRSIGITGPPSSGKTSLWRAVTGLEPKGDTGTVAVPDARLDALAQMQGSRTTTPVHVQVVDVHQTARTAPAAVARLREVDSVVMVIPALGGRRPSEIAGKELDDLILADLGPVETRLIRARKDKAARAEVPVLEAAAAWLEEGRLLRERQWDASELQVFSALAPITMKPLIVVVNVEEEHASEQFDLPVPWMAASLRLEAEAAEMKPEEAEELLGAYGEEPVGERLLAETFHAMDLVTFFTTTEKETRASEVRTGATAIEAAGAIHSDIQRGFIRAEVSSFDEVASAGSWEAAKAARKVRVEGKDYPVADGDVIWFRFSV